MLRVTYLKDINENEDIKKMLLIKKWNIYNIYDQLSINLWVWSRSVDFRLRFLLQGFCVLYFILSEFLTKDVLKCIVNPTYLIGCCDSTLINLVLKTFLLIFNTTHKMGCCEYCYWLGWYNIRRVKSGSLNYPFLR